MQFKTKTSEKDVIFLISVQKLFLKKMDASDNPRTAGQPLSDFLLQLEDYVPTVTIYLFMFRFFETDFSYFRSPTQ